MSTKLAWNYENPKQPGIYFAAIKLGPAAGVYDFLLWSGCEWETDQKGLVIAHIDASTLKNSLDISWPEDIKIEYERKPLSKSDEDLWVEE